MLYILLGILIIACLLAAVYTYITGRLILTRKEGFRYGHYFIVLAVCLIAAGFFIRQKHPQHKAVENNTFTNVHLVVRSGPGYNYKVLGYLYPGQSFKVVSKGNHWAKVASGQKNQYGWVFADDLKSASGLDAWESNELKKTLATNDSLINANGKNIEIKKSDYEEAKIVLQQLHQDHGIKFIDRAHDRAYFNDFLWNRQMSKEQKSDYLEFISDFLGYIQNDKKQVYVKIINYRTGELLGSYIPGKGATIH